MVKSTKSSKSSKVFQKSRVADVPRARLKWLVIGCFVLAVLVVQSLLIADLYKHQNADPTTIKSLIVAAVRGLGKDVPVDAQTGRLYIVDNHLTLPYDKTTPTLRYYSWDDTAVVISSSAAVNQTVARLTAARTINETFDVVPHLQACSRQYLLRFSAKSEEDYRQIATKKLTDGRTVYVYKETACNAEVGQLDDYLKQVDSY